MVAMHPLHTAQDIDDMIHNIGAATRVALAGTPAGDADIRNPQAIEVQKFDLQPAA